MGKLFKRYKWLQLFLGCLLIVAGITTVIIAFVNVGTLTTILSIIIAIVLFTFGIFVFIASLLEDNIGYFTSSLAVASLLIALGVVLIIRNSFIGEAILYFVAVSSLAFGIAELVKAIILIKMHGKTEYIALGFILAFLGIALGIVALCLQTRTIMLQIIYICTGCMFVAAGIIEVIYGIKLIRKQ